MPTSLGCTKTERLWTPKEETFACTKNVVWDSNARGKPLHDLMRRNSNKVTSKVAAQDKTMRALSTFFHMVKCPRSCSLLFEVWQCQVREHGW